MDTQNTGMTKLSMFLRSSAWVAIVFYAAMSTAAPIKLNNGATYETELKEVRLIAELRSDSGQKFALFAGRDCVECDENTSLYVSHIIDKESQIQVSKKRNDYPGILKDYETGELAQKTRTFYGQCLKSSGDSVVWFEEYKNDKGIWVKSEYRLALQGEASSVELFHENQPDLALVLAAAKAGKCNEITGIDGTTEP